MTVEAFAKINLTLEVLGARPDGYHELRSVVAPVSLCDTLSVEESDSLSSDTGYDDDLCLKAARVLRDECGVRRGADIRVTKRIPAGGGLGGGSADAAAVLRALNGLWRLGLSDDDLIAIAARVGSDVPALVAGGVVLMEGRGERVTRLFGSGESPRMDVVLAFPGVHSSTAQVYAGCTPRGERGGNATAAMAEALRAGDMDAVSAALANDLQESAFRLHPEIGAAADALRSVGASGILMSGSGSTVFALARSPEYARRAAESVDRLGIPSLHVVCGMVGLAENGIIRTCRI